MGNTFTLSLFTMDKAFSCGSFSDPFVKSVLALPDAADPKGVFRRIIITSSIHLAGGGGGVEFICVSFH